MKCRSTLRAPFIFFFVLVCLASCASPIQEASWISVKSQRFEMLSTLPEREAVNLIYRLEQLRALIHRLSHTQHRESPVPNLIIAFARDVEFAPFRSRRSVHGYFMLNPRRQYMVLGKSRSYLSAQQIIFHEYIHFLLRNQNRTTYPVWIDEGFAELISTVRSEGDHLIPTIAHELGHACTREIDRIRRGMVFTDEWCSELAADWYAYKWGFGRQIATARKTRDLTHHGPGPGGEFTITIEGNEVTYRVSRNFVVRELRSHPRA